MDPTGFYDTLAAEYHLLFSDWAASRAQQGALFDGLLREALGERPQDVLEATSGIGPQALGLAAHGHRVFASDLSPASIARLEREAAAAGLSLAGLAVAEVRTLSTQLSQRFDAVLSCDNALPHLLDDAELSAAAHHLHAVLRPGGLLIASIRDYDAAEPRPGEAVPTPVRVLGGGEARRLVFQVWTFHEEAARNQARALHGSLSPVEKPLRHASIRTRVSPSRDSVHVGVRTGGRCHLGHELGSSSPLEQSPGRGGSWFLESGARSLLSAAISLLPFPRALPPVCYAAARLGL